MEFVFHVLRIIVIFLLAKRLVYFLTGVLQKSSKTAEGHEERVEEKTADNAFLIKPEESVTTHCCEKVMNKKKAFQVVTEDGTTHYFCSWDCREDFLKTLKSV